MRLLILIALLISSEGNVEAIKSSRSVPYAMGGSQISFSLTGINAEQIGLLICVVRFHDGRDYILLQASVARDELSALCRLPPEIDSGSIDVDLQVAITSTNALLSETIFINPSPIPEVKVEENWDTHELSFTWDPEYFKQFFPPGAMIMIQVTLYVSDSYEPDFTKSGITQVVGLNSGTGKISVTDPNMDKISNIHYPYFYVLSAVGTQSNVYQSSLLFAPTLGMNVSLAEDTCGIWIDSAKVPSPPEEVHPCPPCLCQVKIDANFIQTEYNPQILQLANAALNNHVLYYERVSTSGGHAQTCSYNSLTKNLATTSPAQAGWIQDVSKFDSYVDNYFKDLWPYMVCCLQSNNQQLCDLFHEKRPIETGHRYPGPENPCKGTGDPHMVTFEGVKYDFMGYGEFWLIRGPEGSGFGVQGRMSPLYDWQKVSYYKAVAIRDGNTTVQIQIKGGNYQIFINGIEFQIPKSAITLPLYSVSLNINGRFIDVRLQSGFTITVESQESQKTWFNVYGSGAHSNKGKGFMGIFGNFDDDAQNDLTGQDGFVIAPTSTNLKDLGLIHHRFGLTWMVTANESFFVYEDGKSWEDYENRDFGPILQYPDPETMPQEVRDICGDSLFCYYEYVGTESLDKAADVAMWEQEFDELREEVERVIPVCDVIRSPANGRVQVDGHMNGSVASYSCDEEYDFISGNRIRTCSASEQISYWNGVEPVCIWTCTTCLETTEYELSHDPTDCTKFFLCSYGARYSLECPVSNTFNRESLLCTTNYDCPDPPGC